MKKMGVMCWIALILVVIGGLNLGIMGLFDYNVLAAIFGHSSVLTRIVYILIGLAAAYMIFGAFRCHHSCPSE